jgi:hypothetical protein
LFSSSEIFEKLILKRILQLQEENTVDVTGINHHGFKKEKSTSTLSFELQSMITRALDSDEYVIIFTLDLSSLFDLVAIKLLIKRLKIIGLSDNV